MTDHADLIETVARAICAERCAFYGESPCWRDHEEWWATGGDCSDLTGIEGDTLASDIGCRALAKAAVSAMPRAALLREAVKALEGESDGPFDIPIRSNHGRAVDGSAARRP